MTLVDVEKGFEIEIMTIPEGPERSQLIRLGIAEGTKAVCQEKLPMGPVILRRSRQEIAIGHETMRRQA